MSVLVIAEAGVNHNGDMGLAQEMIAVAAEAGADVVKFQTFDADELAAADAPKAAYQAQLTGGEETQHAMLKRLQLPRVMHQKLADCCREQGVEFLSTAFEEGSLAFLIENLNLARLKIPSGEITNGPFLLAHALTGKDIILSTGMATLAEVGDALAVLAQGYLYPSEPVLSIEACHHTFGLPEAQNILRQKVTILHCTSQYPAPPEGVNLRAMQTLAEHFSVPVGYSDHTVGHVAAVGATCLGAAIIEKHFTLDRAMEGPDHKASVTPVELKDYIAKIRETELMLGDGNKAMQPCEAEVRAVIRKSIVARQAIAVGEKFTPENTSIKRPAGGQSPMGYFQLLQQKSRRAYEAGDLLIEEV
ncbi:MAG: N-acetylneuraminate synthase [Kordiimonadaceae bacterium]|nr:N-acetylneuraminate synthase [Kordiimonadaceae bacterium]